MTEPRSVHPALIGLLQLLPPPGAPWPAKQAWLEAFLAVMAVLYPEPQQLQLGIESEDG